jgi:hypothetical protein
MVGVFAIVWCNVTQPRSREEKGGSSREAREVTFGFRLGMAAFRGRPNRPLAGPESPPCQRHAEIMKRLVS